MRVITGSARGMKLKTIEGDSVRPTSDMVKEAMFSIIQFDVKGTNVLDLFCGSGQLGIEALSRGARYCRFVDKSPASAECTRENLQASGFVRKSAVTVSDSIDFLRAARLTFDIALLDPPYNCGLIEKALPILESRMSECGIVICEHERGLALPDSSGRLLKSKTYRYGKTELTVYRVPLQDENEE